MRKSNGGEHAAEPVVRLYSPAAHAEQAPPSAPVYPALQRHRLACALPASDCVCGGQAVHTEATEAPVAAENVPAGQSVHAEAPEAAEYVPAGHSVHEEPASEYAPARQFTQSVKASDVEGEDLPAGQSGHTEAPIAEYLPALQSVHPALPMTILYVPAAQAEHVPPFGPVNPRLQTQRLNALEPPTDCELPGQLLQVLPAEAPVAAEYVPAGQSVHTEAPIVEYLPAPQSMHAVACVAPVVVMNVPAGQSRHAEAPVTVLYFPATHAAHGTPLTPVNPTSQRQLVSRLVPMDDTESFGHFMQVEDAVAPTTVEYALAGQLVHTEAPVAAEYLPAPQLSQVLPAEAPVVAEYLPAEQLKHVLSVVAAVFPEYLPAVQSRHTEAPVAAEYLPAGQIKHVLSVVAAVLPEYVPASQFKHASDPVFHLYFPAAQGEHGPPSGPVCPALQEHSCLLPQ